MIKETILKLFKLDGLISSVTSYFEARLELMKYEIKEDLARGLAKVSVIMLGAMLFTFFLIFVSVAVAFKLSESLGEFNGFGIVAVFYLVLLTGMILLRNSISRRLEKKLKSLIIQK